MKIQMPEDVKYILEKLNSAGYEAYAVGGCVRDSILGRIPDDWDITTSAKPEETKALFPRTIDTGIQHGTVTVMCHHVGYEVTTYRIDGEYEDSRHPKEVIFTSNLLEDLKRRDFTINAMAYNHLEDEEEDNSALMVENLEEEAGQPAKYWGLVDAFGGIQDIENRMIRCVGNPIHRFEEDALRMMRAVRFSAQLGYEIEEETRNAIQTLAGNLANISAERIQVELVKLLVSDHPDYLRTAYETGMTKIFFPEFDKAMETVQNNPHHKYTVGEHMLHTLEHVRKDKVLRLTMVLHDIAKPETLQTDESGIDHFHGHAELGEKMEIEAGEVINAVPMSCSVKSASSAMFYEGKSAHASTPEKGENAITKFLANYNIDTVDLGVPVLSMHAPYELIAKADIYQAHKAFSAFIKE